MIVKSNGIMRQEKIKRLDIQEMISEIRNKR